LAGRVLAGYVLEVFAFSVGEVGEFVGYLLGLSRGILVMK